MLWSPRLTPSAAVRRLLAAALLLACAAAAAQPALEKVTLQLKWKHQFQFAGYYAALEKGYYRNAGYDVTMAEAGGDADTIKAVLSGQAGFGVATSELAMRRGLGEPVVVLATIMQHSAVALAVRGGARLSVHELAGKSIMVNAHDQELFAYLEREGLSRSKVKRVPQSYDLQDLIDGRVDGVSVYTTDQLYNLRQAKFPHTVLSPRAAGIDFYGDTLFTSEGRVRADRQRAEAFRDASVRGWQYAMAHPEEITDLILRKYSQRLTREHLLFEAAEMRNLMQPDLIEIGHNNPGRWRHIAEVYADLGMLPRDYSLEGFVLDAAPAPRGGALPLWLGLSVLLAVLACLFAARQLLLNRQLQRELAASAPHASALDLALPGEGSGLRDTITGLHNRAFVEETLAREQLRARRDNYPVSVILASLDNLAALHDAEGPGAANALAQSLAGMLAQRADPTDLTARMDAALFIWALPGVGKEAARQRADALRADFAQATAWSGLIEVRGTVTCTVRSWPESAATLQALLATP